MACTKYQINHLVARRYNILTTMEVAMNVIISNVVGSQLLQKIWIRGNSQSN